jgi:methionine-rich copper-binding protein CopC
LITALTVAACASSGAANGHDYEQFRVSCCVETSLQTDWHPGGTVTLHWIVASAGTTTDPSAAPITLTAALSGPFASVAALKAAGSGPETMTAAPLHLSARNPGNPVSTIALPMNLVAGWYNLVYSVNSGPGNSVGGATVIRVTAS